MDNILIVDGEKEIVDLLEIYLKNENYNVYKYYSSIEVLKDIDNLKIDLAILDIMMPEIGL
jgi:two-component system response regulator VanR